MSVQVSVEWVSRCAWNPQQERLRGFVREALEALDGVQCPQQFDYCPELSQDTRENS
jgi:hypothetical protein